MAKKIWKIDKFEGGLNDYSDPKDIKANEFVNIEDVYISKVGSIRPLGQALNSTTVDKVSIGSALIPGKGFHRYKSDTNYLIPDTITTTQITLAHTTGVTDGTYSKAVFSIKTCAWLFTDTGYDQDFKAENIMSQGILKFQMFAHTTAITAVENVLTLDGSSNGSGSNWFSGATMNSDRNAEGTADYYQVPNNASSSVQYIPRDYAMPYNIWGWYWPGSVGNIPSYIIGESFFVAPGYEDNPVVDNELNSYDTPLGDNARMAIGLYRFEGFSEDDFPVPEDGDYDDYVPDNIDDNSMISKPQWNQQYPYNDGETSYMNIRAAFLKNLKTELNNYTSTSGIVCTWPDGTGETQEELEIRANAVGTGFNGLALKFALTSSGLAGTTTHLTQSESTTNIDLLSGANTVEYATSDTDKGNGVVITGDTTMSGGAVAVADIYTIVPSGAVSSGDTINITIVPTGANVPETDISIINNFTTLALLAEEIRSNINSVSTITGSRDGTTVTVTGTAGTANGFQIYFQVIPTSLANPYQQGIPEEQTFLISESGSLQTGSTTNYKSSLNLHSSSLGSWIDSFSDEDSSIFFDWYYTSTEKNDPLFWDEGNKVRISDGNFNLSNKNKWFGFIDNSDFFPHPSSTSHNGFVFLDLQYGFFLENMDKKWVYTAGSTSNPGWTVPDSMGVRIDAHGAIADIPAEQAAMNFQITTAASTGIDWAGNIRVYLVAVYDDGSESLPGHQFTFSGGATELDMSTDLSYLKIQCNIRPQNSSGEYLFNDRRIRGVRLYYTHSEEEYELFHDLGLVDFANGFLKADEVATLDDTTGNTSNFVWSDVNDPFMSVQLYDIDGSSADIIYNSMPKLSDYTSNNEREIAGVYSARTLNLRYKVACIAGRRSFVGNIKVTEGNNVRYYNDRMVFSPVNELDIYPYPTNVLDLDISDGDEIIALASYGNIVLQFKQNIMYVVDISSGEPSSWSVESRNKFKGVSNKYAICETSDGIFWFNEYGAYMYNDDGIKDLFLSEDSEDKKTQRINPEIWADFISSDSICGFNPKSREVFVIKKASQSTKTDGDCYVYNLVTSSWVKGKNKFWVGNGKELTNIQNIGDDSTLGFVCSQDSGTPPLPPIPGDADDPGVPF